MPETTELHARLLADANNYDPSAHNRSLLAPYRDVLLLWRAKFMSYEQIASTLSKHGLKVSPAGVGVYCRKAFTKTELDRARAEQRCAPTNRLPPGRSLPPKPSDTTSDRRGPKVARDDY